MNLEAVRMAYGTLKKAGITKNPRGAFMSCVVASGRKTHKFASLRVAVLVNILQQELLFPPFFTRGITYIEYVSISKRAEVTYHESGYFLKDTLKNSLPQFKELLATARCFI